MEELEVVVEDALTKVRACLFLCVQVLVLFVKVIY